MGVPEAILAVIVGGLLSFLPVAWQLRHDRNERERDRLMSLRRDVFLEAAAGLAGSQQYFFRFANTSVALSELSDQRPEGSLGWFNKVRLVASLHTIEAFAAAEATLASSVIELLRLRSDLQSAEDDAKITQQSLDQIAAFQKELTDSFQAVYTQPLTDESVARGEWVAKAFQEAQNHLDELRATLLEQNDRRWSIHRTLLDRTFELFVSYQDDLSNALAAIRREIDLPIDEIAFKETNRRAQERLKREIKELMDHADGSGDA